MIIHTVFLLPKSESTPEELDIAMEKVKALKHENSWYCGYPGWLKSQSKQSGLHLRNDHAI